MAFSWPLTTPLVIACIALFVFRQLVSFSSDKHSFLASHQMISGNSTAQLVSHFTKAAAAVVVVMMAAVAVAVI